MESNLISCSAEVALNQIATPQWPGGIIFAAEARILEKIIGYYYISLSLNKTRLIVQARE